MTSMDSCVGAGTPGSTRGDEAAAGGGRPVTSVDCSGEAEAREHTRPLPEMRGR